LRKRIAANARALAKPSGVSSMIWPGPLRQAPYLGHS